MDKLLTAEEWRINNCIMAEWTDENVEQYASYKAEKVSVMFAEWLNIRYRELNHTLTFREKTLKELLDIFNEQILKQLK